MFDIEFCPECGAPVVGTDASQMCTGCGLMYSEMIDLLDEDDLLEDDEIDPDDGLDLDGVDDDDMDPDDMDPDDMDSDGASEGW